MSRNNQLPTCGNSACGNQGLTIKNCLQDCRTMTLLGKDCEVEKMMRFLRDIGIFEEIQT